jgi:hypothetical protein
MQGRKLSYAMQPAIQREALRRRIIFVTPDDSFQRSYIEKTPGIRRSERGLDHPAPSSAEVKERVELYLYSSSEPL